MFFDCTDFNGNVTTWNPINAENMGSMFEGATSFNQDISGWNMSSTNFLYRMFKDATSFDQNLGNWNISNVSSSAGAGMDNMFDDSGMSTENYSKTLIGWANFVSTNSDLPANITLGAANITYSNVVYGGTPYDNAVDARNYLVNTAGWIITDGGQV